MKKIFSLFLILCLVNKTYSQCALIMGAMANSCSSGPGEGVNEFVIFKTVIAATAADYTLYYGSGATPKTGSTGHLSGLDASAKTGTGSFFSGTGCTINEVTSPSGTIPANSSVIFIPADFDQQYDVSGLCSNGAIYVVYINRGGGHSTWGAAGTLVNSGTTPRYLQLVYQSNNCTGLIRSYTPSNWASQTKDGNSVWWDNNGTATYINKGCGVISPPVPTVSITATTPVSVCAGATTASIAFSTAGTPDQYSIVWNTAAKNAGFTDITNATLPASPLSVNIPSGATAGSYTASLTATNTTLSVSSTPQTITVTINSGASTTIALSSAIGTDSQIVCANSPIVNIKYSIAGATNVTVAGLPAGVTGSYSGGVFTISGSATANGTFSYTVTTTGAPCTDQSQAGKITVGSLGNIVITASGPTTLCFGDSVVLAAPVSITATTNNAVQFTSTGQYINPNGLPAFSDNFTFECWVNPTGTITLATQSTSGTQGTSGERYALYPTWGGSDNALTGATNPDAGAGLSVGTNGIAVYEHGASYLTPLLVWPGTVSGWTHIAVVYINKQPSLYINGVFVKTGLTSLKSHVYPSLGQWSGNSYSLSGGIGGGNYGYFNGQIDEFRLWDTTLAAGTILNNYNKIIQPVPATHLYAYYRFDETSGNTTADLSGNNLTGTLVGNPARVIPSTAPVTGYSGTNNYTYLWAPGGQTDSAIKVGAAGTYTVTVTNASGCSGTGTETVQIITPVTQTITLNGCISVLFNGTTYTSSVILKDTLKSTGGCDSIYHVTNIQIQNIAALKDTTLSGCGTVVFDGVTYTVPATVKDTLKSIGGCDSVIITAAITVYPGSVTNITDSIAPGRTYTLPSGITVSTGGDYQSILKTVNGCDSVINTALIIESISTCAIIPSKGFTPNGDGHNDTWVAFSGDCVKQLIVSVYNRWGGLVYHSDNYSNDWQGKYKDNTLPDATYYYTIEAVYYDGHHQYLTGNVTIIR